MTLIVLLACIALYAVCAHHAPSSAVVESDLDRDGKIERIVLDAGRDPTLTIWRGDKRLWQGVPKKWKPWKLTTADVDGDGVREIIVGVHKSTRFFPQPHNCLFVYGWDGTQAFPKWLGSSLSKPFSDFAFANLDDDKAEELVSLETLRDGKRCVVVYSWIGFGFGSDYQRGAWKSARLITTKEGRVVVEADGKKTTLGG